MNNLSKEVPNHADMLAGKHPDLAKSHIPDPGERARLSSHLGLRDIFNPYCFVLARDLMGMGTKTVGQLVSLYDRRVYAYTPLPTDPLPVLDNNLPEQDRSILQHHQINTRENIHKSPFRDYVQKAGITLGRYEKCFWTASDLDNFKSDRFGAVGPLDVLAVLKAPVGEYGDKFARQNLLTTKIMLKISEQDILAEEAERIRRDHHDFLRRQTGRGFALTGRNFVLATMHEGIISIGAAISQFTAQKLPGYEEPEKLLEAIIDQDLISSYATTLYMGIQMPMFHNMQYVENILNLNKDGKPILSKEFQEGLRTAHHELGMEDEVRKHWSQAATTTEQRIDYMPQGKGCPVGRKSHEFKHSGLGELMEAYLHIFKAINRFYQLRRQAEGYLKELSQAPKALPIPRKPTGYVVRFTPQDIEMYRALLEEEAA